MKRSIIVLLFLFFSAVWNSAQSPSAQVQAAEKIANLLGQGKFNSVRSYFDPMLSNNLSAYQMQQVWYNLLGNVGTFAGVAQSAPIAAPGVQGVDVWCATNQAGLVVRVAFHPGTTSVSGLWVFPAGRPPAMSGTTGPQSTAASASPHHFELRVRKICCDKTTEHGADEVYVLVVGKRTDGQTFSARLPADAPHQPSGNWDMNDGDQPTDNPSGDAHCRTNKTLFSGDVSSGQTWELVIMFMEEDGGTTESYQKAAGTVLQQIDNPYAQGAGVVISTLTKIGFFATDTDDFLGSFGVRVTDSGAEWKPMERLVHSIADQDDPQNANKREFRMNGDGSNYVAWIEVQ